MALSLRTSIVFVFYNLPVSPNHRIYLLSLLGFLLPTGIGTTRIGRVQSKLIGSLWESSFELELPESRVLYIILLPGNVRNRELTTTPHSPKIDKSPEKNWKRGASDRYLVRRNGDLGPHIVRFLHSDKNPFFRMTSLLMKSSKLINFLTLSESECSDPLGNKMKAQTP